MARPFFTAISFLGIAITGAPFALAQSRIQPCVILKRMGSADELTSHISLSLRGKQYQFVEGTFPNGIKFRGSLADKDLRKIQEAGGKIVVVESGYSDESMEGARRSCAAVTPGLVTVGLRSTPDGADITVDGKFMGNTPSVLRLSPGDHVIAMQKSGFKPWQRTINLMLGETPSLNGTLEPEEPQPK